MCSGWLWEHNTLWRKGTQDGKIPAAYSWEYLALFFILTSGQLQAGSFWPDKITLRVVYQKGFFSQEEFILQWQEDAIAYPAKFIWKGSFAMNQSIFFSYHRQKSLFQKQSEAFSLFCTTATLLTSMPKLISQALRISGQKEKPEVWVAAQ